MRPPYVTTVEALNPNAAVNRWALTGGTYGQDEMAGGVAGAAGATDIGNLVHVTIGEGTLRNTGLILPSVTNSTGYSAPTVISAHISPAQQFVNDVAVSYSITGDVDRQVTASALSAYNSGATTFPLMLDLSQYDSVTGYEGIVKKLAVVFRLPSQ